MVPLAFRRRRTGITSPQQADGEHVGLGVVAVAAVAVGLMLLSLFPLEVSALAYAHTRAGSACKLAAKVGGGGVRHSNRRARQG